VGGLVNVGLGDQGVRCPPPPPPTHTRASVALSAIHPLFHKPKASLSHFTVLSQRSAPKLSAAHSAAAGCRRPSHSRCARHGLQDKTRNPLRFSCHRSASRPLRSQRLCCRRHPRPAPCRHNAGPQRPSFAPRTCWAFVCARGKRGSDRPCATEREVGQVCCWLKHTIELLCPQIERARDLTVCRSWEGGKAKESLFKVRACPRAMHMCHCL
jgi:hypothetical protein